MTRRVRPASGFGKPVPLVTFLRHDAELQRQDDTLRLRGYRRPDTVRPYLCLNGDVTVSIRYRKREGDTTFQRTTKLRYAGLLKR